MGRRWTGKRFSRRAALTACLTCGLLLALGASNALAAQQVIISPGPVSQIYLNDNLGCQAFVVGDTTGEFFGGTNPGACGTFLSTGGTSYGPNVPAGNSRTEFTPVSQTPVTGAGTASSPYKVVTTVNVGLTAAQIVQTDTYVVGQQYYRTDITVNNNSTDAFSGTLYHAGDCYLQGSDSGYGWIDSANHGIYCTANANNSPAGRLVGFQAITGTSNYAEAHFSTVWGDITASGPQFPNTCDCTTFEDNGAGLSWPVSLGGSNSGANSATFSLYTAMSPSGQTPASGNTAPPAVAAGVASAPSVTSASFTGQVNPNNLSTAAVFQYGLDPSYTGGGPVTYTNQVTASPNPVGSDNTAHAVSASVTGLVPNALYHVRLVAANGAGATLGQDQTFRTNKAGVGRPTLGRSFNASPVSGRVFVKLPGSGSTTLSGTVRTGPGFVPLTQTLTLPAGTQIDVRSGSIKIITATGNKGKRASKLQNGTFNGGIFNVKQARSGRNRGLVTLKLLYGLFPGAPTFASCTAKGATVHAPLARVAVSGSVLSTLRSRSHGRYSTSGHYGSATSRGTAWTITDRCKSTLITVQQDTVVVRNFVRHKTITLRAGQRFLIKARR